MEEKTKSRVDSAVPKPENELSESEKQALEKSGAIEHQHGAEREKTAEDAEK